MTQQEGFRPAGRQSKRGRCTLCGNVRTLTKAHVPPKAAFNQGNFAWGGTTSDNRLTYGRAQLGGASRYAHCNACRAITSPWDDEYIRWAHCFAGHLVRSPLKGLRAQIAGELDGVRPGRFIRAALAGMTALTPSLIDSHPDLVRTVREGCRLCRRKRSDSSSQSRPTEAVPTSKAALMRSQSTWRETSKAENGPRRHGLRYLL
ncbi:hypothetical protein PSCLAVI8L_180054 [Pseudoclavibacter sp. 8L]|nr:hypothetical protein PSCLAVI8L_180054 [Pseudoclavibacter sp. 8L]